MKLYLEPKCSVLYFPIKIDQRLIESIVTESVLNDSISLLNNEEYSGCFNFTSKNLKNEVLLYLFLRQTAEHCLASS